MHTWVNVVERKIAKGPIHTFRREERLEIDHQYGEIQLDLHPQGSVRVEDHRIFSDFQRDPVRLGAEKEVDSEKALLLDLENALFDPGVVGAVSAETHHGLRFGYAFSFLPIHKARGNKDQITPFPRIASGHRGAQDNFIANQVDALAAEIMVQGRDINVGNKIRSYAQSLECYLKRFRLGEGQS